MSNCGLVYEAVRELLGCEGRTNGLKIQSMRPHGAREHNGDIIAVVKRLEGPP